MDEVGEAVKDDPLPDGLHEYDDAPLAETVVLLPLQMVGEDAEAVTLGFAFTVNVADKVNGQPRTVNV